MIRSFMFVFSVCLILSGAAAAGAAPQFFQGLRDVPLMPGLVELDDQGYVFDKPQGRIGESMAYGDGMSPDEILEYYRESLPQFGWKSHGERTFFRDGEKINLQIDVSGAQNILKVSISPR